MQPAKVGHILNLGLLFCGVLGLQRRDRAFPEVTIFLIFAYALLPGRLALQDRLSGTVVLDARGPRSAKLER